MPVALSGATGKTFGSSPGIFCEKSGGLLQELSRGLPEVLKNAALQETSFPLFLLESKETPLMSCNFVLRKLKVLFFSHICTSKF